MSTYSSTLRLELIGNGQQDGTWGDTTNLNLGTLLESAITNAVDITFANATYTLSTNNGLPDEARNAVLNLTGTNSAAQNLLAPEVEKTYIVVNNTGANVTIKTTAVGSNGVTVPNLATRIVWSDGTDFFAAGSPLAVTAGTGISVATTADLSTITLANTGVTANTYSAPTITVNAQGQITSASSASIVNTATGTANAITVSASTGNVTFAIASGSNGYGVRTVSTSAPSGGNDGDIWYQVT